MQVFEMMSAHPRPGSGDREARVRMIEAATDAGQASLACADACLGEADPGALAGCIAACLDAAELLRCLAVVASRQSASDLTPLKHLAMAAKAAAETCASRCESHDLRHCALCAKACRSAGTAIEGFLKSLAGR